MSFLLQGQVSSLTNYGIVPVTEFGAVGNGIADDTAAVKRAITALTNSTYQGTLYFPPGTYLLSGTGTEIFLLTKVIPFSGANRSLTTLLIDTSVGASTDVIRYAPTVASTPNIVGWSIRDLMIYPKNAAGQARHCINLDATNAAAFIQSIDIDDVLFGPFGGRAVVTTNPTPTVPAVFCSRFTKSTFYGGLQFLNAADSNCIDNCVITGKNAGIEIDLVSGAAAFNISRVNCTSEGGAVWIKRATKTVIQSCYFERGTSWIGGSGNSCMIDLDGVSAGVRTVGTTIRDTQISILVGLVGDAIRANFASDTLAEGNYIFLPEAASNGMVTTANALRTDFDQRKNSLLGSSLGTLKKVYASAAIEYINDDQLAGLRNKIRNGDFQVWQRGTSFASPVNTKLADGWQLASGISGDTTTISRVAKPGALNRFGLRYNRSVAKSAGAGVNIQQRIENVATFAGRTVTVSFEYISDTAFSGVTIILTQNFGTGGAPSTSVTTSSAAISYAVTATPIKVERVIAVPSIEGKTLGSNGDDYFAVLFNLIDTGTLDFSIFNVQIEDGVVATAFEDLPYMVQLERNKRYFERIGGDLADTYLNGGMANSTTVGVFVLSYSEKRALPTSTYNGTVGSDYEILRTGGALVALTAIGTQASTASKKSLRIQATVAAGLTAGEALVLKTKTTSGTIDISAEL